MRQFACGNIYIREGSLEKKGDVVDGHTHNFDHCTYLVRGSLHIERTPAGADGKPLDNAQPEVIVLHGDGGRNFALIKASYFHKLTALEDNTLYQCVYAHRKPDGEVIQSSNGWTGAYC